MSLTRLVHLALGQQLRRVGERAVRLRVQAQVGHGAVEQRHDRRQKHRLHGRLLQGDDGLDLFEGVVGVAELERVEAEGTLEGADSLLAAQRQADAAGELRRVERVAAAVLAQDRFVAALHTDDAPRRVEQVEEVVDLALVERGDLAAPSGVLGALAQVTPHLVGGQRDRVAVAHARGDAAHAPSYLSAAVRGPGVPRRRPGSRRRAR